MSVSTLRFLRITIATLAGLVVLLVIARFAVNLATAETRGTVRYNMIILKTNLERGCLCPTF